MKLMSIILPVLTLVMLSSCHDDHDLCHDSYSVGRLIADYDRQWEYPVIQSMPRWHALWPTLGFSRSYQQLCPSLPTGLRTVMYDDNEAIDVRNIKASGGLVYIWDDDTSMLVYSNDSEYDLISDQRQEEDAMVYTRYIDRPSYHGSPFAPDATRLITPPDVLYLCQLSLLPEVAASDTTMIYVLMRPVVYTYAVRYGFCHGQEYVAQARGVLAGMSEGAWLWSGYPVDRRVGVAFDAQCAGHSIEAYVHSFGHDIGCLCYGYGLNLEVRLTNGRYLNFDFDITAQMRNQPRGGVIIVDGIEIPDSIGRQPAQGGFDVTVDGWGEFEDIPITI